jgi:hypothetical protein
MKRVVFGFLAWLGMMIALLCMAPEALGAEPASATAPAAPAAAPAPVPVGKSDLDDELPPDVRQKLTPEQLQQVLIVRAKSGHDHGADLSETAVPIGFFGMVIGIVAIALYAGYRNNRQRHDTMRLVIERGGQIPPGLLAPPSQPKSDLRRGILLLGSGSGLGVLLLATHAGGSSAAALIPVFLGLGYLIVYRLESKSAA